MFFEFDGVIYNRNHVVTVSPVNEFSGNFDGWDGYGFTITLTNGNRLISGTVEEKLEDARVKFLYLLTADGRF